MKLNKEIIAKYVLVPISALYLFLMISPAFLDPQFGIIEIRLLGLFPSQLETIISFLFYGTLALCIPLFFFKKFNESKLLASLFLAINFFLKAISLLTGAYNSCNCAKQKISICNGILLSSPVLIIACILFFLYRFNLRK